MCIRDRLYTNLTLKLNINFLPFPELVFILCLRGVIRDKVDLNAGRIINKRMEAVYRKSRALRNFASHTTPAKCHVVIYNLSVGIFFSFGPTLVHNQL